MRPVHYLMGGLLLAGIVIRIAAACTDFWLDEIWSYALVRQFVASPLDILSHCRMDNNHPINTLWLYLLGRQPHWFWYRVPSLVAGAGSIAVAGWIMARRGTIHALIAVLLFGLSFPLIVYSSEARGYGPLVLFTLLAFAILDRRFGLPQEASRPGETGADESLPLAPPTGLTGNAWGACAFAVVCVLGFLSHPIFLHCYLAAAAWSLYRIEREEQRLRDVFIRIVQWHAVPFLFFLIYYEFFLRGLRIGGADPQPTIEVLLETLSLWVGAPETGALALAGVVGCLLGLIVGCRHLYERDFGAMLYFVGSIVVAPALTMIAEEITSAHDVRYFPRYFLVSYASFLLLMSWLAGDVLRKGQADAKVVCCAALVLALLGNLVHIAQFLKHGRGHYQEAVRFLAEHTAEDTIRLTSNNRFRAGLILSYYHQYLPGKREFVHCVHDAELPPQWWIVETVVPGLAVPAEFRDPGGTRFVLKRRFPFYGLSGSDWSLFRRVEEPRPITAPPTDAAPDVRLDPP